VAPTYLIVLRIEPTFDGLAALVTGAAGGLGRAVCEALVARGAAVVATDADGERAAAMAEELTTADALVTPVALDVTSREAVEAVVAEAIERHGRLDVVVNLAGIVRNQVLVKIDDADFALVMATHVNGTLNTMRAALPHMRERQYGRIVNTSSLAVRGTIAGSAYGAAKGAIEGITRSAALEAAKHGVTINCIAPGLVDTGLFRSVPEDYQAEQEARIPMGRAADPAEVASCVAFLAAPETSYVTGQTLVICGGLSLGL